MDEPESDFKKELERSRVDAGLSASISSKPRTPEQVIIELNRMLPLGAMTAQRQLYTYMRDVLSDPEHPLEFRPKEDSDLDFDKLQSLGRTLRDNKRNAVSENSAHSNSMIFATLSPRSIEELTELTTGDSSENYIVYRIWTDNPVKAHHV